MQNEKEKLDKRKNILITTVIQLVVFLVCYFLIAWREPIPPIPEYGIELNFGFETSGSGQTATNPDFQESEAEEELIEETIEPENVMEEPAEAAVEEITGDLPVEEPKEVPKKEEPVKEVQKTEPVKKPEVKKTEPVKTTEVKKVETTPKTPTAEPVKPTDDKKISGQGTTESTKDQGVAEGKIDERALFGSQGGGKAGASLAMTGWVWDEQPNPDDKSDESGQIVFEVTIDSDGYIVGIKTIKSTVTPATERVYRQSVERLTFSKSSGYVAAAQSKGTISFIIKTR